MKKRIVILLFAALTLLTAACGKNEPLPQAAESGAASIPQAPQPVQSSGEGSSAQVQENAAGTPGVDVDLTALSSTMVYAEVYQMMMEPESYVGKTVKMRGNYYANFYEGTQRYYHFAVIADATACCSQGLEFLWQGTHSYPEDYPAEQAEIEITGVFESYEEEGNTYYHVVTDGVQVLSGT